MNAATGSELQKKVDTEYKNNLSMPSEKIFQAMLIILFIRDKLRHVIKIFGGERLDA